MPFALVIQGARYVLEKANAVRLAYKAHANIQSRYCGLADPALAGTPAGTVNELSTLKDLVRENITEVKGLLDGLASKIPQDEHRREGDKTVNDYGGEEPADGSRKRKLAGRIQWTKVKSAMQNARCAGAAAFNIDNVCETLESAEKLFRSAIDCTTAIRTKFQLLALSQKSDSILNRKPNLTHAQDVFSPFFDEPALPSTHVYDFESRDHNGARSSPEGRLLDAVLRPGTGDRSHGASALGAHGMGGVGKTTALKRICHDAEVRGVFADGVCFLEFGQDATDGKVMGEMVSFVSNLGGSNAAEEIREMRRAGKLGDVVDRAAEWIKGRAVQRELAYP